MCLSIHNRVRSGEEDHRDPAGGYGLRETRGIRLSYGGLREKKMRVGFFSVKKPKGFVFRLGAGKREREIRAKKEGGGATSFHPAHRKKAVRQRGSLGIVVGYR
ncbi:hypothetical protein NE237_019695 [Protea cynaroides]|uniref:Uncharacterized protein n=1 Tax=Protea cynaroides TaxID=273540 RepID=A0A9Q0H805_9MAGN|nr:hypothetical protein NE237_019695 [Protea cynaroides]